MNMLFFFFVCFLVRSFPPSPFGILENHLPLFSQGDFSESGSKSSEKEQNIKIKI